MKFNRSDYQESIIDLRTENGLPGGIPADEPVFLLRARDKTAPHAVMVWAFLAQMAGASKEIVDSALAQAKAMAEWQEENSAQTPTLPGEKP